LITFADASGSVCRLMRFCKHFGGGIKQDRRTMDQARELPLRSAESPSIQYFLAAPELRID